MKIRKPVSIRPPKTETPRTTYNRKKKEWSVEVTDTLGEDGLTLGESLRKVMEDPNFVEEDYE